MTRLDFFQKTMRYLLFAVLAFVALALGRKVAYGSDCSVCPGKGICAGRTDCSKY